MSMIQAVIDEANDEKHSGAGWHFRCQLVTGEIIVLPIVAHGPDWVKLDLERPDSGCETLFVHERQIVWAVPDFAPVTIGPNMSAANESLHRD